jgi:sec-independent protein translocase protein TatA
VGREIGSRASVAVFATENDAAPSYNPLVGTFAFIGGLSPSEMVIILVLGLLLFGSRLPQVGRSLGKSLAEFKRGLRGIENEMESAQRDIDRSIEEEERQRLATKSTPSLPAPDPSTDISKDETSGPDSLHRGP